MKIKLIHKIEHWLASGEVLGILETLGNQNEEQECFIEEFMGDVVLELERNGHEIEWVYQQSRGVGVVCQNTTSEAIGAYQSAVNVCAPKLKERLANYLQSIESGT
jgi:hypothetical protein